MKFFFACQLCVLISNKKATPFRSCFEIFIFLLKMYKVRVFKACEARKTAAYLGVCEDFKGERNAENTALGNFYFVSFG